MEIVPGKKLRQENRTYFGNVARNGDSYVVSYRDKLDESVVLIPLEQWASGRERVPVADNDIAEYSVRDTRDRFGDLRESVAFDGQHALVTRNGADYVVFVPLSWAREALPDLEVPDPAAAGEL